VRASFTLQKAVLRLFYEREGNVNVLFILILAESLLFGSMWHNGSARCQMECENDKPAPDVLPERRPDFRKLLLTLKVKRTVEKTYSKQPTTGSTI
jgi:hypothetical protein